MPAVDAVRVSPTCAVPPIVGAPVAGRFGRGSTVAVGALVNDSALPASSVNDSRTFTVRPSSASVSV